MSTQPVVMDPAIAALLARTRGPGVAPTASSYTGTIPTLPSLPMPNLPSQPMTRLGTDPSPIQQSQALQRLPAPDAPTQAMTSQMQPLPMSASPNVQRIPTPQDQQVQNSQNGTLLAQNELHRLQSGGSGIQQITRPVDAQGNPTGAPVSGLRKFGGVLARIGEGVETALTPGFAEATPGTALHNQMLQMQQQGKINEGLHNQQEQAQTQQTQALTNYTQQRPEIEQSKIDQRQTAVQERVGQAAAARGQLVSWDANGIPAFTDDHTSQAFADHQALAAMHQATSEKTKLMDEIAKNHYIPGTEEYKQWREKMDQVDKRNAIAMGSLGLRAKGLALREENQNANLYGVGANGQTLVNAPQFEDDEGNVITGGLKGAATAIKQQGAVGTFKDLGGSIKRTQGLLDQLHNSGADLSDYRVVDALQGAEQNQGTLTTVLHSRLLKSGLTEPQVNAIAGLASLREQLGTLRAASKGTGSEGQTQRMLDAAPNAGDTKEITNRKMVELQATYDRLSPSIATIGGGLSLNGKGGRNASSSTPSNAPAHSLATAMALPFNQGKTAAQVTADLQAHGYKVVP